MANEEWHVGAVLKNKLNSQGTLFRGGTKYSSDKRYPRGYTPERQAAVREQVKGTGWNDDNGLGPANHRREIADTLAKSTVPVEHLKGLQWAHVEPHQEITSSGSAAGAYFKPHGGREEGMIGVKPQYTRTSTVIHEVGHHVSHTEGNEWRNNYSYGSPEGGQEEAFADNYADAHFRDKKGNPSPRGIYGGGPYGGRIERSDEFWGGYRANRHYAPDMDIHAENEKYFSAFPEERETPDGSVEQALIHREREYGGYDKKTGKQEIRDVLGDVNEDAIPSHANHDWSKYHG